MDVSGFNGLAAHFEQVGKRLSQSIDHELDEGMKRLAEAARSKYGVYQAGWPQLADSTQAARERAGYTANDPLFASGKLAASVTHLVEPDVGRVHRGFFGTLPGQKDEKGTDLTVIASAMERGTIDGHIPARPVYGPMAYVEVPQEARHIVVNAIKKAGL